jgi:hypothetical protein
VKGTSNGILLAAR